MHSPSLKSVAWSSCSRFIAIALSESTEVLDGATLEKLHTFIHPSPWNGWLRFSPDSRSLTRIDGDNGSTTWDLQTGGLIGAIPTILNMSSSRYSSSTYSTDGKIVAVAYEDSGNFTDTIISTYNLISGIHIYSHRVSEGRIVAEIWTHGEFLRFATMKPGSITIWEVGFTSEHMLAKIESLPAPDNIGSEILFLPTLSRLAFTLAGTVLVWDARDSKFILNSGVLGQLGGLSFSSDGRFFACGSNGQGVHLWKESPTGYDLHQTLVSGSVDRWIAPSLSPDGESIITYKIHGYETQLWRTTDPINPRSSVPTQPVEQTDLVLAFSPDKSFMATGRLGENIATILNLKSGDPRLIVDTGTKICGLGVTGSTVIVVGEGKIITWNLPVGDCVIDARADIHDSVRTVVFDHSPPGSSRSVSISPDFNHLAAVRGWGLDIYDMSTGKHVAGNTVPVYDPWFTRDGREVWYHAGGWKIIRDGGSDVIGLEPVGDGDGPSGGHLWESSHGHKVTDDYWILDSRKKRVMWLPYYLRAREIWDEQFLALLNCELPEPVIIELYE